MIRTSIIPNVDNVVYFFVEDVMPSLRNTRNDDADLYFDFGKEYNGIFNNYNDNGIENVIKVRDLNKFFRLLTELYDLDVKIFNEYKQEPYTFVRMQNFFRDIWVRASDLDFENIEDYLQKQIDMYKDRTFSVFDTEMKICSLEEVKDVAFSVKNNCAMTWDEAPFELSFRFYDYYYEDRNFGDIFFELPKVRYGIYKNGEERICRVGSIQKDVERQEVDDYAAKALNRAKYMLIDDKEDFEGLEPSKVLSFMIFIKFLKEMEIDKIEIPRLYVLDYNYHLKTDKVLKKGIKEKKKENESLSDFYDEFYEDKVGKADVISKAKSEDLSRIAIKAKDYMSDIEVLDMDNRILLDISKISLDNIDNDLVRYFHGEIDHNKYKYLKKDKTMSRQFGYGN